MSWAQLVSKNFNKTEVLRKPKPPVWTQCEWVDLQKRYSGLSFLVFAEFPTASTAEWASVDTLEQLRDLGETQSSPWTEWFGYNRAQNIMIHFYEQRGHLCYEFQQTPEALQAVVESILHTPYLDEEWAE